MEARLYILPRYHGNSTQSIRHKLRKAYFCNICPPTSPNNIKYGPRTPRIMGKCTSGHLFSYRGLHRTERGVAVKTDSLVKDGLLKSYDMMKCNF